MSKVKNYYWDLAEKEVDKITDEYLAGHLDLNTAENKISEVDNVELACTAIPQSIKYAQYELAKELANETDAMTGNKGTDGTYEQVKLGEIEVKYNTDSQGVGTINNVFDVYPWLQSYLGAYCLGGSGSYQVRVVRG